MIYPQSVTLTDNFDGPGLNTNIWSYVVSSDPGIQTEVINGELKISGTNTGVYYGDNGPSTNAYQYNGNFNVSVSYKAPSAGYGLIYLMIYSTNGNQVGLLSNLAGGNYKLQTWNPWQLIGNQGLFGDEQTNFHQLSLSYNSGLITGKVDNIIIGTINVNFPDVFFRLVFSSETSGENIDIRFDNFYAVISPIPLTFIFSSQNSGQPIQGASVVIAYSENLTDLSFSSGITSSSGEIVFNVPQYADFTILCKATNYDPYIYTLTNVSSSQTYTLLLNNLTNNTYYEIPAVISALTRNGTLDLNGVCSAFDVLPYVGSNIYNLNDFLFSHYISQNFDFYILVPNNEDCQQNLNLDGYQDETIPGFGIRPDQPSAIGLAMCNFWSAVGAGMSYWTGSDYFLQYYMPYCEQYDTGKVTEITSTVYAPPFSFTLSVTRFKPFDSYSSATYSSLDQIVEDQLGRKIGSYYENGIFIEDKYEIPNCYYSGHLAHPNLLLIDKNLNYTNLTCTLIPTALGDYKYLQRTVYSNIYFDNLESDTAFLFTPITKILNFPETSNSPIAICSLCYDSLYAGDIQIFDASNSYDPQGMDLNFEWWINNQLISTDSIFSMGFQPGEYHIFLKVFNTLNNNNSVYDHFYVFNLTDLKTSDNNSKEYFLYQNYPNPFNPMTQIKYILPFSNHVKIELYDILGQPVKTLFDGNETPGVHTVSFNASNLASGIYIYLLKTEEYVERRKMILMK